MPSKAQTRTSLADAFRKFDLDESRDRGADGSRRNGRPGLPEEVELALWGDLRVAASDAGFGVYCRRFGVPLVDLGGSSEWAWPNRLVEPGGAVEASIAIGRELACLRHGSRGKWRDAPGRSTILRRNRPARKYWVKYLALNLRPTAEENLS